MAIAATATFRFSGSGIRGLLAKVEMGVRNGVTDGADLVEKAAQSICPVDTGALRDSISTEILAGVNAAKAGGSLSTSLFAITASVAPHVPYAAYVEFGTGQRGSSSPGAGPGPYNSAWRGQPAQPYMRPAMDENRQAVIDGIRAAVKDALA